MSTWNSPLWGTTTWGGVTTGQGGITFNPIVITMQSFDWVAPVFVVSPNSGLDVAFDVTYWLAQGEALKSGTWSSDNPSLAVIADAFVTPFECCRLSSSDTFIPGQEAVVTCILQTTFGRSDSRSIRIVCDYK